MFRVVFFIESTEDKWSLGPKIWRDYFNWFSIQEDAAFEMGEIHYLKPSHRPGRSMFGTRNFSTEVTSAPSCGRVLIVRPSEAQARKPSDLYLSRIVMEFQNSFFKYKLWGFSSFSIFRE